MTRFSRPSVAELRELLTYDPDEGTLRWHSGKVAFTQRTSAGYPYSMVDGISCLGHRVAWALHYGAWPVGQLRFIDRDKGNLRIANLRPAIGDPTWTRPAATPGASGVLGVYWRPDIAKWRAAIDVCGRSLHLGYYTTLAEAAAVRRQAELERDTGGAACTASE